MSIPATIGERIRHARDAAGRTRLDLASAVGVYPTTLQRWESGDARVPADAAARIAQALGVDVAWLLLGVEAVA